jgi:hypothetical protein
MNVFLKIIDKLYLKQWSIGVANISINEVIRNKKIDKEFKWIPINNNYQFFADPFIFSIHDQYKILYEELDYKKQYGYLCQFTLNNYNEVVSNEVMLDTKSHLSYPFIYSENNTTYIFPESASSGKLSCFKYNEDSGSLTFVKDIIDLPLLDSTILKHKNKYWLFCTMKGVDSNKKLYIFFSENLFGPYTPHPQNPVKNNIDGARPAGNFIRVDGAVYRPAQNSNKYYGSSISINKILILNEKEFAEENHMTLLPDKKSKYNFGIHTLNHINNLIVIDGLNRSFLPFTQMKTYISKKFKSKMD